VNQVFTSTQVSQHVNNDDHSTKLGTS
jgi:hypothetical protein